MPKIYLSPSLQDKNYYVDGGTEEYYMRLIADAMEPYLTASGISFDRSQFGMNPNQVANDSNQQKYGLHLAIHSNAAAGNLAGKVRGVQIYYYPTSVKGRQLAEIIAANYRGIYPEPMNIALIPSDRLAELKRTQAPAVLIETAFHDNPEDAGWIKDNIETIARSLSQSVAQFLNVPFVDID